MAVLKLLRNNELYPTREAAISGIQTKAATLSDGEMWVATWGTQEENKSILAVKRTWGVTIFDLDAISGEISGEIDDLREALANIAFTGFASDATTKEITASETTVAVAGTNAADQIANLAQTMKSIQDNAGKYKLVKLTAAEVAELSDENVKEAYKVVTYQGEETEQTVYTQVGDTVKIYKDSALKEVYLGSNADSVDATTGVVTKETVTDPQSMNFVYQLADGTYTIAKVDVSKFLSESEFGDGLQVNQAGVVLLQLDPTSEKDSQSTPVDFLTVGANGIKVQGIKDEIAKLKSEIVGLLANKADATDLESLNDDVLKEIKAGNGIDVSTKAENAQTVSVKLNTTATDNALSLDTDGLYFSKTIDCGSY